jgi:hypothetical protein
VNLKKFKYIGPCNSSVSLAPEVEGGEPFEVLFFVGKEVELPEDNEYVNSLVFQGLLKPIEVAAEEPPHPSNSSKKRSPKAEENN